MPEKFKSKTEMIDAVASGKIVYTDNNEQFYRGDGSICGPWVFVDEKGSRSVAKSDIWSFYDQFYIKPEPLQVQITDRIELMNKIIEMWDSGMRFFMRFDNDTWHLPPMFTLQKDLELIEWIPANEAPDGEPRKFMKEVEE